MNKVLIINAHQKYEGISEGKLTQTVIDNMKKYFNTNEYEIKESIIDHEYTIEDELEKLQWADYIVFQYPVYWMSLPWKSKKYFDEVLGAGYGSITYKNDGRSRSDASKTYGSGGLLTNKKYMLSLTYNCPTSEFDNKDGFFEGLSLDEANYSVHKIFQFCGLEQLKTYSMHDVFKSDLNIKDELSKLDKILKDNFKGKNNE